MTHPRFNLRGFTLVELIGVLAVMSMLAAVVLPAGLRTLEHSAVRAERENLRNLGRAIADYTRANRALPSTTTWTTQLTTNPFYVDQSPTQLATNSRNVARRFIVDPSGATRRAVLVSGMRNGVALPSTAALSNITQFNLMWDSLDGVTPAGATWAAWAAYGEFLVIERFNYTAELSALTFSLNNTSALTPAYRIVRASGTALTKTNVAANTAVTISLYSGDRVELYAPSATTASYIYSVGETTRTLQYNGTSWSPQ